MLINCPYCGPRPSEEFTQLGDASVKRPTSNDPQTMDQWFDYVYLRDNPKGRFKARNPEILKGLKLVLVDDIMTTGATLEEAAGILKAEGAVRVEALCVARGLPPR